MKHVIPQAVKDLSNRQLTELFQYYNLYGTTSGGKDRELCIPGPTMMQEIKKRLLSTGFVDVPPVFRGPFHILLNDQGRVEEDVMPRVWKMFHEILDKNLWPADLKGCWNVFQEVNSCYDIHGLFKQFEKNLVVLTVTGGVEPPKTTTDKNTDMIYATPYTGWYFSVLDKNFHTEQTQKDISGYGFFNSQSITKD